ncbi:hypothetical protein CALCODRAFT_495980 [Calocera cornea HHB12733]|uniref:Uncharacterized protein n=1 Tax=Calocera cornea HHB12733 TaxID=1353952 RepID=A0A165G4F4_9BASI|nr:hypothetical protein CALCODRAFT_495980 [Calocera cornea HHB12733]
MPSRVLDQGIVKEFMLSILFFLAALGWMRAVRFVDGVLQMTSNQGRQCTRAERLHVPSCVKKESSSFQKGWRREQNQGALCEDGTS